MKTIKYRNKEYTIFHENVIETKMYTMISIYAIIIDGDFYELLNIDHTYNKQTHHCRMDYTTSWISDFIMQKIRYFKKTVYNES
jgi:hypothetical protein